MEKKRLNVAGRGQERRRKGAGQVLQMCRCGDPTTRLCGVSCVGWLFSDAKSYDSLWCSVAVMPSLEFANKVANSLHLADVVSSEARDDVIGMQAGEES